MRWVWAFVLAWSALCFGLTAGGPLLAEDGKLILKRQSYRTSAAIDIEGEFDADGKIEFKGTLTYGSGRPVSLWLKAKVIGNLAEGWGEADRRHGCKISLYHLY